jgi:hypothetical protein
MSDNDDLKVQLAAMTERAEKNAERAEKAEKELEKAEKEREKAEKEREKAEKELEIGDKKGKGEYWGTFDDVLEFGPAEYADFFISAVQLRQNNPCQLYAEIGAEFFADERAIECLLDEKKENAPDAFQGDSESRSCVSNDSLSNRTTDKNSEKLYAKNMLGELVGNASKSRAHTIPADKVCYKWWGPMYQLVTGYSDINNLRAIHKLGSMRTSKFIFAHEHNEIYDILTAGVVCTIPIFESMEAMAKWQYGDGYKMLIIADSASAYTRLGMLQDRVHKHITIAEPAEVENATKLLAEMMKIMADSLVSNWDHHYSKLEEEDGRKKMLESMRELLRDGKIDVPTVAHPEGEDPPKLYTIDFNTLYEGSPEGAKYIIDPFPALIKSGMNLSYFTTVKKQTAQEVRCKLLPECKSSFSSDDEDSYDFLRIIDRREKMPPKNTFQELIGKEIDMHVASDDESDDDDDLTQ